LSHIASDTKYTILLSKNELYGNLVLEPYEKESTKNMKLHIWVKGKEPRYQLHKEGDGLRADLEAVKRKILQLPGNEPRTSSA
jgi:hypothetical protein